MPIRNHAPTKDGMPVFGTSATLRAKFSKDSVARGKYLSGILHYRFNDKPLRSIYNRVIKLEEDVTMIPVIDKRKTGEQIRKYMNLRGLTVQDVKEYLSLGCVQSVYHWLDGQSLPSLDNLYALSELLRVPMDMLVAGNRSYKPEVNLPTGTIRLLRYYRYICESMAA